MSHSVPTTDPLDSAPTVMPVLARLPRVGFDDPQAPSDAADEISDAADESSDGELPILVLLDDDTPAVADAQEAAIDALADAAVPAWQDDDLTAEVDPLPQRESATPGSDVDAAGATPIFRIHRGLAPYSSVIVTVAVIAAAGLLFMVASQPTDDRLDYDAAWADTTPADRSLTASDPTLPTFETTQAATDEPTETGRSTIVIASRPRSSRVAETTPRELPEMTLGPPQAYPSTGSQSFEDAFFNAK